MPPRLHGGAIGTELARRGFTVAPPSWSAAANLHAPALVAQIHHDYAAAGATLTTANTTCAHACYVGDAMAEHCARAIALARGAGIEVAASLSMLPATMTAAARDAGYRAAALALRDADVLLLEGFVDANELLRAIAATAALAPRRWAALAGPGVAALATVARAGADAGLELLAVHCCTVADASRAITRARADGIDVALGAYPSPSADDGAFADELVALAQRSDLAWIGACCGSTPATIAALARRLADAAAPATAANRA